MSSPTDTKHRSRLFVALAIMLGLYALVYFLGFSDKLSPTYLRGLIGSAGGWGSLAFGGILVGGVLAQIPGMVFLAAAPLLFPIGVALPLCLVAGNLAVNLNFALVRRLGGRDVVQLEQAWAQRALAQLEDHPLRTVFILRVVFIMFPPLTGVLALTSLRARDHAFASAIGMALPISAVVVIESLALG